MSSLGTCHKFYLVNKTRVVLETLSNMYDGTFCEITKRLKAINYFLKKLRLRSLTGPCLILTIKDSTTMCANLFAGQQTRMI